MHKLCFHCRLNYVCKKIKATGCKQWRTQVRNISACPAFPGTVVEGETDADSRRSKESQELVYEES